MSQGDLHFSVEVIRVLSELLERYCTDTGSLAACLLDECGNQLVQGGAVEIRDHGETAALAAGAFAATRQLAGRLGESEFDGLMHHGRHRHFYLSPITRDFLLLTVFAQSVPAGIVRLCASKIAVPMRNALLGMVETPAHEADSAVASPATDPATATEEWDLSAECDSPLDGPFASRNIIPMPTIASRQAER